MSDFLKHECGVAAIRLLKPLSYFQDKYGSTLWAFNKLLILMEKQYNRGQDGAGIRRVKLNSPWAALPVPHPGRQQRRPHEHLQRANQEAQ